MPSEQQVNMLQRRQSGGWFTAPEVLSRIAAVTCLSCLCSSAARACSSRTACLLRNSNRGWNRLRTPSDGLPSRLGFLVGLFVSLPGRLQVLLAQVGRVNNCV